MKTVFVLFATDGVVEIFASEEQANKQMNEKYIPEHKDLKFWIYEIPVNDQP